MQLLYVQTCFGIENKIHVSGPRIKTKNKKTGHIIIPQSLGVVVCFVFLFLFSLIFLMQRRMSRAWSEQNLCDYADWLFLITETVGEGRSASRGMALSAVML